MKEKDSNLLGGIVLLLVGGYFLLRNTGILTYRIDWDIIWPVMVIAVGVWLLLKNR